MVEDTETGVTAGEAAGCQVIAVPSVAPVRAMPGRRIVTTLEEIDMPFLHGMMTGIH